MKLLPAIAAAFTVLIASADPSGASPFTGMTITNIVLQDDLGKARDDSGQIRDLILVKPGDRFSSSVISEGIAYAYLTGWYSDIRVEGFPENGGVKLAYTLVPRTIVERIKIKGNDSVSTSTLREALQGVLGRELREDKFSDYRTNIMSVYQARGYYGTGVHFNKEQLEDPHKVALEITIKEPARTLIGEITFTGNTKFTKQQLLKVMKSRPGRPLQTQVLFDQDMRAILDMYTGAGYPAAKPGPVNISFRDEKAFITIAGNEGPRVSVRFSGNEALSTGDLEKQVLIWPEHDVSDSIIDSSAEKIRNVYREKGYASVKVSVKKTEAPGTLDLLLEVQEGRRITVKEIELAGNSYLSSKKIKAEMSLREPGWFTSVPFRQELLDKDVEYLRDRYLEAGFLSVDVNKKVDLAENEGSAVARIEVTEGPQTRVGRITFEGNAALTDEQLLGALRLKPGVPYNERLVDEDRYHILSAYSDQGYLYARADVERKPADGTIDVVYRISEDRPVAIGKVIIRGNELTKTGVIQRELLVKPGDTYDYEKILKSQQRIYRFGYFNLARFEPVTPGEKTYRKDMILSLEERPAGSVEFGAGYGDLDRARAFAEVSHRNVWGLAHYAGLRIEGSDIVRRAIFNYQHPWSFGYDLNGKFALTWSDYKDVNADTREIYYETRKTAASYGVEKNLDRLRLSLTYAFENVENYNVQPGIDLSEQDIGHVRVSSLSPALVWDLRDDIFNPRKGSLYGIVVKQAMHQLGSEADYTWLTLQTSWYLPLSARVVSALSAKAGSAWPHYQTTEIPIHERFYLGGSTTVRGYNYKTVGPTSDGTLEGKPTGGSSMWLLNAEIRFMSSHGLGFVLFSDAGRVWVDQPDLSSAGGSGPADFRPPARASYGAGIRYSTPVGPLRIDYGQKIHRRPGESPGELHFNIGHTF